jgi:3-oxoacyl-[acyl-carrier protein] reductase
MKTIKGKRALVTGAASGIGRAIAMALAREGANLCLLDIDDTSLGSAADAASEFGVRVITRRCDLARSEDITAAVNAVLRDGVHLDILVNNAGISYHGKTDLMSERDWNRVIAINLLAPMQLTRELLPTLLANDEAHIVNVCSVMGLVAIPRFAVYQASKFGLVGFSESLRAEYTCQGLGVTAICPGYVRTNIFQAMVDGVNAKPMRRAPSWMYARPEKVAARVTKAIYRNDGVVPITLLASFLWVVKRYSPRFWDFVSRSRKKRDRGHQLAALPHSNEERAA